MANQPKKYKKFVATAATATLVAAAIVPVASAAGFTDVKGSSHEEAINALAEAGIINGYADGTFKPNQDVNRGQVVKLLGRWLETEGYEAPADWETKQYFKDLPLTAEKELLKYAALSKEAGVFEGSNGNLNFTQKMQRQQMAVVLVRAINEIYGLDLVKEYKAEKFTSEIADLDKAFSAEQREAITALEYAELTNVTTLPGKKFNPANSITRGQFASFLYRTINIEVATSASVKAINSTTVEVTFDEEVENIQALNFEIKDLEVKNAAVKQSNKKVVVLTTAPQTAGKEYTVSLNAEEIGKFKGIEAVIPTSIDVVEKSQQNVLGNQVTVKAKIAVAEGQSKAGIPVTFNIVNAQDNSPNPGGSLNQPIVAEAVTNEEGVATYTYTRYAATSNQLATSDEVQAYATGKPAVRSFAKVYWANIQPLTITEVTTGATINNGAKKVYKVKVALDHAEKVNNASYPNHPYQVNLGFKENLNVTPDKAVKDVTVTDAFGNTLGYPGQWTTTSQNGNAVKILLDKNGEGTFTLSGNNATVTPFVFVDQQSKVANAADVKNRFDETELFAQAPSVTFAKAHNLAINLEAKGVEAAAKYQTAFTLDTKGNLPRNTGGRSYVATIADLQGATAGSKTPVYVSVAKGNSKTANNVANVFVYDEIGKKLHEVKYVNDKPTPILLNTDAKGQVKFKLVGDADSYATPTVFVDSGDKAGQLDSNDLQQVGSIVYFGDVKVEKARLTVDDESETTVNVTEETEFVYETVDQNDNPYYVAGVPEYTATFDLTALYNNATVKAGTYGNVTSALGTINQDSHKVVTVKSDTNGRASVKVEAVAGTRVTANVSASTLSFGNLSATAIFTNLTNEGASNFTGKLLAVDTGNNRLLATDKNGVVYELKYAENELRLNNNQTVDEATFATKIGNVFSFTQKTNSAAAVFNVEANQASAIDTTSANSVLKTITINADQTPAAKVYDFGNATLKGNIKVNGENVTIKNLKLDGTITVGDVGTPSTSINYVDDFSVENVTAPTGGAVNVILNNGDGNTFTVTGSTLNEVTVAIPEHVAVGSTSTINDLKLLVAGSSITGAGTVKKVTIANNSITFSKDNQVKIDEVYDVAKATAEATKALEDAIKAEADAKLVEGDYTPATWTAYAKALADAKAVDTTKATIAQIEKATKDLAEAKNALVKKEDAKKDAELKLQFDAEKVAFTSSEALPKGIDVSVDNKDVVTALDADNKSISLKFEDGKVPTAVTTITVTVKTVATDDTKAGTFTYKVKYTPEVAATDTEEAKAAKWEEVKEATK
ncbi:S-layer homology domain-containing protein [Lysinibacillus sp. Bpr_S20]|uniref:S-layer homology domain-containing protein n=1 Tax=Lysinibacillus sp. Bpr_S20 TaxID=2933964 RepID=UPI002011720F|nr:S-layer homology domain-containing protein [Lysinibacillus sp. Bpr_S20]MCL1699886.1 S-layer homology domain-containing protein [Lysinibacillus sp. Bpr_S20]